jgi:hypothetical protein
MAEVNREFVRIVEHQGRTPVGIPVLLFTDKTLDATDDAETANVVHRAATDLGYDLDAVELFSTEAYLVQSVAGQLTVGP